MIARRAGGYHRMMLIAVALVLACTGAATRVAYDPYKIHKEAGEHTFIELSKDGNDIIVTAVR